MVGVPGKSKGCTTCRRRKVRCDEGKPHCDRCIKAGRSCEGYKHFPVFLVNTPDGPRKRKPLEEADVSSDSHLEPDIVRPAANRSSLSNRGYQNSLRMPSIRPDASIWSSGMIAWFWQSYVPAHGAHGTTPNELLWLRRSMEMATPSKILHHALLSISTIRLGRVQQNETVVKAGQRLYGQCLYLLQRAIQDPRQMHHDHTLAAVRTMALYELFEATSVLAWSQHVRALSQLILSRGSTRDFTPVTWAIFEEFRYPLMIYSLMECHKTPFANPVWRDTPWMGRSKDKEQVLWDFGLDMACLLHRLRTDVSQMDSEPFVSPSESPTITLKLGHTINSRLDGYRLIHLHDSQLLRSFESDAFWKSTLDNQPQAEVLAHGEMELVINWLALKLCLTMVVRRLATSMQERSSDPPQRHGHGLPDLYCETDKFCNSRAQDRLVNGILWLMGPLSKANAGRIGSSRSIFPLSVALIEFRSTGVNNAAGKGLMSSLTKATGFAFAKGMNKTGVRKPLVDLLGA